MISNYRVLDGEGLYTFAILIRWRGWCSVKVLFRFTFVSSRVAIAKTLYAVK